MSEPQSPLPENQDPTSTSPKLGSISPDPLLQTGSYIDPTRTDTVVADAESPKHQQPEQAAPENPPPATAENPPPATAENPPPATAENPQFPPGVVIAAEPISMYLPGEEDAEAPPSPPPPRSPPRSSARRRNREEMSKRPSWLPDDWTIDLRVRSSGATAGLIDRYYVAPTGQRRFRSKNEVLHFLETGIKLKRKAASETDAGESGSAATPKEKRSSAKRKKAADIATPPARANGVKADT